jgi:hypothetical protein
VSGSFLISKHLDACLGVSFFTSVQNVHTDVMMRAFILPNPLHMLPLNAHLEIKALTASPDGACVAAVMPLFHSCFRIYTKE